MHCADAPCSNTLALVVSIEKLYGAEDIIVVRLVVIQKADNHMMTEFYMDPEGRPRDGSTKFCAETLYLVRKSNGTYCRVREYELLNTEIRTQLFMHSYGYVASNSDFGNIRRYLEEGEQRRLSYLSSIGEDQNEAIRINMNANIQMPAPPIDFKGN